MPNTIDLTAFNSEFTPAPGVTILEWTSGSLSNGGEEPLLSMPGDLDNGVRQYIRIDKVNYSDGSHPGGFSSGIDPWPTGPDGSGDSLLRINSAQYGNDVANWESASPTPGAAELWSPDPAQFADISAGHIVWETSTMKCISLPVHTVSLNSFYMGKYEITNQQYCDYLNWAYPALIKVDGGVVYAADDSSNSFPYCDLQSIDVDSQIIFSGSAFSVNIKNGITDMSDHPMVEVNWYGCVACCNWMSSVEGLESCYDLSTTTPF